MRYSPDAEPMEPQSHLASHWPRRQKNHDNSSHFVLTATEQLINRCAFFARENVITYTVSLKTRTRIFLINLRAMGSSRPGKSPIHM